MLLVHEALKSTFTAYLDAYFTKRNLDAVLEFLSPNITCFGTGLDEKCLNFSELKAMYERDILQAPNRVFYQLPLLHISECSHEMGIVLCVIHIKTSIMHQDLILNDLRMSLLFKKLNGAWLIEHLHISLPTVEHEGDESYPIKELEERHTVLSRLVEEKTHELHEMVKENKRMARTDELTGLANRRMFDQYLREIIEKSAKENNECAIILIDIDKFKTINDGYGHLMGDAVLVKLAALLRVSVREMDFVSRWGGEEFIVLCSNTNLKGASIVAEKIRRTVESYTFDIEEAVTISAGVAMYHLGDTSDTFLTRVDKALYEAKTAGRNRVYF